MKCKITVGNLSTCKFLMSVINIPSDMVDTIVDTCTLSEAILEHLAKQGNMNAILKLASYYYTQYNNSDFESDDDYGKYINTLKMAVEYDEPTGFAAYELYMNMKNVSLSEEYFSIAVSKSYEKAIEKLYTRISKKNPSDYVVILKNYNIIDKQLKVTKSMFSNFMSYLFHFEKISLMKCYMDEWIKTRHMFTDEGWREIINGLNDTEPRRSDEWKYHDTVKGYLPYEFRRASSDPIIARKLATYFRKTDCLTYANRYEQMIFSASYRTWRE